MQGSKSEFDSYLVPGIKDSLASSSEEIANDLWESILSYYQPKSTFSSSFPSKHLHSIKQVLCTEWSVFKKEISDDEWYKTVLPLMRKYLDSDIQEDFDRLWRFFQNSKTVASDCIKIQFLIVAWHA